MNEAVITNPKIILKDLNFHYGNYHALKSVNLSIPEKKVTAFIGPSGCGKSTLLRTFNRMYELYPKQKATGEIILDGVRTSVRAGFAIVVPAGANHNIINTGSIPLKLYTLYAPPNHRDGVVHHTRADAEADTEHFDGGTSE